MPDSTITGTHPTFSALRGALMVFEAADKAGLPIPTYMTTNSYGAIEYGHPTRVTWVAHSLGEVTAWAAYLDRPVEHAHHGGAVHHTVSGQVFDQHVEATWIEDAS